MSSRWTRQVLVVCVLSLALPGFAAPVRADVVLDWNNVALAAIRVDRTPPPKASRALACVHTSMFDAINSASGGAYDPYIVEAVELPSPVSLDAAAAEAAYGVLIQLFPAQKPTFDAALATSLAAIPDGPEETAGVAWGASVAQRILAERQSDNADVILNYDPPVGANWWAATPPSFLAPLLPNWPYVKPWSMASGSEFRQGPPPASTSPEYTRSFLEVLRLGRSDSAARTPEQTEIALFWADGPGTATPPGHWHVIAQGLSRERGLDLIENARLFALLAIAGADAAVVSWDQKYYYGHWRPITGIQHADADGNPATVADPSWTPLITTPPFPSYTSGHSTFSSASARILALFFGTDQISFSTTSDGLTGVTRSFTRLSEAAAEAGQSRIYGGIHWQYDNQAGLVSGRALADQVYFNRLAPLAEAGPCTPGSKTLCLAGGRFKVEASWQTADAHGQAHAVSLGSDSGTFWFFNEDNTEVTVKVLNACDGFNRYWVFASGLTNVETTITVTDTLTRKSRRYFNPQGKAFAPVQDTDAFATCP